MEHKLEIFDLGDATKETKQPAPIGHVFDNIGAWGMWY